MFLNVIETIMTEQVFQTGSVFPSTLYHLDLEIRASSISVLSERGVVGRGWIAISHALSMPLGRMHLIC